MALALAQGLREGLTILRTQKAFAKSAIGAANAPFGPDFDLRTPMSAAASLLSDLLPRPVSTEARVTTSGAPDDAVGDDFETQLRDALSQQAGLAPKVETAKAEEVVGVGAPDGKLAQLLAMLVLRPENQTEDEAQGEGEAAETLALETLIDPDALKTVPETPDLATDLPEPKAPEAPVVIAATAEPPLALPTDALPLPVKVPVVDPAKVEIVAEAMTPTPPVALTPKPEPVKTKPEVLTTTLEGATEAEVKPEIKPDAKPETTASTDAAAKSVPEVLKALSTAVQTTPPASQTPVPQVVATASGFSLKTPTGEVGYTQMSPQAADNIAALSALIQKRMNGKSTQFDMQLKPADQGRVDVRLEIAQDGKISAHLSFDNPISESEFRGKQDDLKRQLEQAGFQLDDDALSFSSRDPQSDTGRRQQDDARNAPSEVPVMDTTLAASALIEAQSGIQSMASWANAANSPLYTNVADPYGLTPQHLSLSLRV